MTEDLTCPQFHETTFYCALPEGHEGDCQSPHELRIAMLEAELAARRALPSGGDTELEALRKIVKLSATRFDIMAARFRGCDAIRPQDERHEVSIPECEDFAAECRAALSAPTREPPQNEEKK